MCLGQSEHAAHMLYFSSNDRTNSILCLDQANHYGDRATCVSYPYCQWGPFFFSPISSSPLFCFLPSLLLFSSLLFPILSSSLLLSSVSYPLFFSSPLFCFLPSLLLFSSLLFSYPLFFSSPLFSSPTLSCSLLLSSLLSQFPRPPLMPAREEAERGGALRCVRVGDRGLRACWLTDSGSNIVRLKRAPPVSKKINSNTHPPQPAKCIK